MKRYQILSLIILLAASLVVVAPVWAQLQTAVELLDVTPQFPRFTLVARVTDGLGHFVTGLDQRSFQVLLDGAPMASSPEVQELRADADHPTRPFRLRDGSTQNLCAVGTTIAVVPDLPPVLGSDRIAAGEKAAEAFLEPIRAQQSCNPVALSVFVPIAQPGEQAQQPFRQADADGFTIDLNDAINAIRTLPVRKGKTTNLYATVQDAVDRVARVASRRGSQAVVLVLSDGIDGISSSTFDSLLARAHSLGVTIVAFDYHRAGSFRLNQLASTTGGLYLQHPDDTAARDAFARSTSVMPTSLYEIAFTTDLRDDGQQHTIALQVALPEGTATSRAVKIELGTDRSPPPPKPAGTALSQYLLLAIPALGLVSLLIVLLVGTVRWVKQRALHIAPTL